MKRLAKFAFFTSIAFCLFPSVAHSQIVDNEPWCPKGANWVYRSFSAVSNLYYKFSYQKDSIVQSQLVKVLTVQEIEYKGIPGQLVRYAKNVGKEYVYASNDSVYWYDKVNDRFAFIYTLHPSVGDYWVVGNSRASCPNDSTFPLSDTIYVTSSKVESFGDRTFQTFYTSYDRNYQLGTILANIGPMTCPFPQINVSKCHFPSTDYGTWYYWLVCYSDSLRGIVKLQNSDPFECDPIVLGLENEFHPQGQMFTVYPNPANNLVSIKNLENKPIKQMSIFSTLGNIVFDGVFPGSETSIDISHLNAGLYTIKIMGAENQPIALKLIKR